MKQQTTAESAYNDAKTIRLKALRLEKEAQDAEAARIAALNAPPAPVKKRASSAAADLGAFFDPVIVPNITIASPSASARIA